MKKIYSAFALAAAVSVSAVAGVKSVDETATLAANQNLVQNELVMNQKESNDGRQKALNYTTADQIAGEYIVYCNSGFDSDDHECTVYIKKGSAADEVIVYGFFNNLKGTNVAGGLGVKGTVKNEGGKCTIVFTQQTMESFSDGTPMVFYPYDPFTNGGVVDNMTITVCPTGVQYSSGATAYEDGCLAGLGKNSYFISNPNIISAGSGYALWYNIIMVPVELYGDENQQFVTIDESEWKSVGNGKFTDGYMYPVALGGTPAAPYTVPVLQKNDNTNVFLIKQPYGANTPYAEYNETPDAEGYIYIDATNPEVVLVRPMVYSGLDEQESWEGRQYMANEEGVQYFMDESSYDDILDYFDYYDLSASTMVQEGTDVTININNGGMAQVTDFFSYGPWTNSGGNAIACNSVLTFSLSADGVGTIATENNGVKRFFNLQGVEVANPEAGQVVIVRENGKSVKVAY